MQEPHVEDVANHNDPESCGAHREVHVEALTGGSAGQPLSLRQFTYGEPTVLSYREGTICSRVIAMATANPCGVLDPGMRGHFWRGNREISNDNQRLSANGVRREGQWP